MPPIFFWLPGLRELFLLAIIGGACYVTYRVTRRYGSRPASGAHAHANADELRLLREISRGMQKMDERVELMELVLKDVKSRMDRLERRERIAGGR